MLDSELAVAQAHEAFDAQGRLVHPELTQRLQQVLGELAIAALSAEEVRVA